MRGTFSPQGFWNRLEGFRNAACVSRTPTPFMSFKDQHPEFQHLARELTLLAAYNRAVLDGRRDGSLRLHSFLALSFVALERFLRIVLGVRAGAKATLPNLLQQVSGRNGWIEIPDRDRVIHLINEGRRATMHGNLGLLNESEHVLSELLAFSFDLFGFIDGLVATVDPRDGNPKAGANVLFVASAPLEPSVAVRVLTPDVDLRLLRASNKAFAPDDSQDELLLLAEGCLCAALLEGVCRKALVTEPDPTSGFRGVLDVVVLFDPPLLRLPFDDQVDGVARILAVKNTLAHGSYERAAVGAGVSGVAEYFKTQFAGEIERLFNIYEYLLAQLRPT